MQVICAVNSFNELIINTLITDLILQPKSYLLDPLARQSMVYCMYGQQVGYQFATNKQLSNLNRNIYRYLITWIYTTMHLISAM